MGDSRAKMAIFGQKWPFFAFESSIKIEHVDEFFWNFAKRCPVWVPKSVPKIKKKHRRPPTAGKKSQFCLNKDLSPLGNGSQSWSSTHSVCSCLTALRWTWGCALHGLMVPRMANGVLWGDTGFSYKPRAALKSGSWFHLERLLRAALDLWHRH